MARRRRRGTGSVFRAADGTWVARISLGVVDGRRLRRERRARDEAAARAALDELLAASGRGADPADPRTTLDAYLADWLVHVRATNRAVTWIAYRTIVRRHISPVLGGIPVTRLRPSDVRALIRDRLGAGLSPTTVRGIVRVLSGALEIAVRDGSLGRNVARGIVVPRPDVEPRDPITAAEARAILRAVAGDRHEAAYVTLLGTGLRRGELLGLRWRDVDLERATLTVRVQRRPIPREARRPGDPPTADVPTKTVRSRRTIPLPAFVVATLRRHRSTLDPDARVFEAAPTTLTHRFPVLLARAGLRQRRLHDLRHAAATLMLASGTPMRAISDHLGHASMAVTANVYAGVVPELARDAVDRLDDQLRETR